MASAPAAAKSMPPEAREYVLKRYRERIEYYWKASRYNKRLYKTTRYLLVVLGAMVTLISSLSAAEFIKSSAPLSVAFAVATPVLAALTAIVAGVSQAFQWGATWSDSVMMATRLEKERDRITVAPAGTVDAVKELALLDELVIAETQGFFGRLFGSAGPAKQPPRPGTV